MPGIAGAAFAGASIIDALDGHDGHVLTKGHAGVAVLPALLAYVDGGVAPPSTAGQPQGARPLGEAARSAASGGAYRRP